MKENVKPIYKMYKQRIQTILEENNTAQSNLEALLDKMDLEPNKNEINIYDSLHGTLDLSILETKGFSNVQTIWFHREGELVEINGFPKTLKRLNWNRQLLTELTNLPKDLEVLECEFNNLEELDFSENRYSKLKILKCSNNFLSKIENLPETLEEIYCENNQIKRLNLQNVVNLKVLHCSNNQSIILEGFPPSILDFKGENNPLFDNTHFCRNEGEVLEREAADLAEKDMEYADGIYQYFKIKNEYEKSILSKKREVFKKEESRNKAKRKITKILPKCIHCSRPVGTNFSLNDRNYTAVCGDHVAPCKLNIKIYAGDNDFNNETVLYLTKKTLDEIKGDIIKQKMETVLNYMSEKPTSIHFKETMEEYNSYHKEYLEALKTYEETMYGDIRKECIREKQIHVYELLAHINELIKDGHIEPAVKMQIKELFPEIENLQKLKYDIMEMNIVKNNISGGGGGGKETEPSSEGGDAAPSAENEEGDAKEKNENKHEYSWLFQNVVALHKRYKSFGSNPKVIHFVV
jgi:hypothetical protein